MQSYLCCSEINANILCKIWYTENGEHSFTVFCIKYHYCVCIYTLCFAILWIEHHIGKVFWHVGGNGCLLFRIKIPSATPNRQFRKKVPLWKCEVWYRNACLKHVCVRYWVCTLQNTLVMSISKLWMEKGERMLHLFVQWICWIGCC